MKLIHESIQTVLQIKEASINSLVIENPSFLYDIVKGLKHQADGYDGNWVLSKNDKPVEIHRSVELITDLINFEVNQKNLINKVISSLEKTAREEEYLEDSLRLLSDIERYIYNISEKYDISLQCEKMTIQQILKAVGIKVEIEGDQLIEIVYSYMQLIREFDCDKLFVILNMRDFVSEQDFLSFSDTVIKHGYHVLYIDNKAHNLLENENRLIIDNDLCEI